MADGHVHACQSCYVAGPASGGVDDVLGRDYKLLGVQPPRARHLDRFDVVNLATEAHLSATVSCHRQVGRGQQMWIDHTVASTPGGTGEPIVCERCERVRAIEIEDFDRHAVRAL